MKPCARIVVSFLLLVSSAAALKLRKSNHADVSDEPSGKNTDRAALQAASLLWILLDHDDDSKTFLRNSNRSLLGYISHVQRVSILDKLKSHLLDKAIKIMLEQTMKPKHGGTSETTEISHLGLYAAITNEISILWNSRVSQACWCLAMRMHTKPLNKNC